jgi:hypothetical protein
MSDEPSTLAATTARGACASARLAAAGSVGACGRRMRHWSLARIRDMLRAKESPMKFLFGLVLVLAVPFKQAVAAPEVSRADMERFLAFFEKLVDTIVADKDNCPKMAGDVNALVDANADLLKKAAEAKASGQKPPADLKERADKTAKRMIDGLGNCMNDKGVQNAIERMNPNRVKSPPSKK